MEPDDLNEHELAWLLGLTAARRRKKETAHRQMRPRAGQTARDFREAADRAAEQVVWARKVEDHLIQLLADIDPSMLLDHQAERLAELEEASWPATG